MSEEQTNFLELFKRQLIIYAVIGLLTVLSTSVGFYYNTRYALDGQRTELERMNKRQGAFEINLQHKIDKGDYIREMDEVKQILREMESKIDRLK